METKPMQSAVQESPLIFIGLGNPGDKYHNTRHNIGFRVLDELADRMKDLNENVQKKWKTITASGTLPPPLFSLPNQKKLDAKKTTIDAKKATSIAAKRIILAKPQTFMNLSGEAVQSLKAFYKSPQKNLIVIADDIDLPFGQVRFKKQGSGGTHNGLRSIESHIGRQFYRLKVGVGSPLQKVIPTDKFVLGNFNPDETKQLPIYLKMTADALQVFVFHGIDKVMNNYNGIEMASQE